MPTAFFWDLSLVKLVKSICFFICTAVRISTYFHPISATDYNPNSKLNLYLLAFIPSQFQRCFCQNLISRLDTCTSALNLIAVGWYQTIYISSTYGATKYLLHQTKLCTTAYCMTMSVLTHAYRPPCQPPTIEYVPLLDQSIAHNATKCICIAPKNISYGESPTRKFMNPNSCSASSFPE